ncbi:hypothetical protein D9758_009799 [Tetrapyrgos nigripes]|uniref:DNA2/NAM7 helicase-like C-terminal domain-containing protein n=1 Tax=Tetrapyrgos nigripes TaxID=182062 RepID=A0A8H5GJZ3_9AGAR|nr:hypothetical protein D9758_009799 [Tetrapyrgos nigripes]
MLLPSDWLDAIRRMEEEEEHHPHPNPKQQSLGWRRIIRSARSPTNTFKARVIFLIHNLPAELTDTFPSNLDRMPIALGAFISLNVYNNGLKSQHKLTSLSCVSFIDAAKGFEENSGFSWRARKDFCVITPYDAQRSAIERALKAERNEADYDLISVVRTKKVGFLKPIRRMNVMLSRCRAGMVIVSNKIFLSNIAYWTLLGRLAEYWEHQLAKAGFLFQWATPRDVFNDTADLPGVRGKNAPIIFTPAQVYSLLTRPSPLVINPSFDYRTSRIGNGTEDPFPPLPTSTSARAAAAPAPPPVHMAWSHLASTAYPAIPESPPAISPSPSPDPDVHSFNSMQPEEAADEPAVEWTEFVKTWTQRLEEPQQLPRTQARQSATSSGSTNHNRYQPLAHLTALSGTTSRDVQVKGDGHGTQGKKKRKNKKKKKSGLSSAGQ